MIQSARTFLKAAEATVELLERAEVAEKWDASSALPNFSVGGLACHLGSQILSVPSILDQAPSAALEVLPLVEHYSRAAWVGESVDSEANVAIRDAGEDQAADWNGAELVDRVRSALRESRSRMSDVASDRAVAKPSWNWALRWDDFLLTRVMEMCVHSDDLAVSVDVATPKPSAEVVYPTVDLLTRMAMRRHGPTAVLRALSRAERAPGSIAAL